MADTASIDPNRVKGLMGTSYVDNDSPVSIWADPNTHQLYITGSIIANPLIPAPLNGQVKISITGTKVQLPSHVLLNGVIVTAYSGNTNPITIGTSAVNDTYDGTGNGYILEPGNSASWAVKNTNNLYINGTSGDYISFAGS